VRTFLRIVSLLAILGSFGVLAVASSSLVQAQGIMLDVDAPGTGAQIMEGRMMLVGGWVVAPGDAVMSVDVYLDSPQGMPLGTARLGIARPDVAAALGRPDANRSGYNFDWMPRNVAQGDHTLYIVARTASGQSATQAVPVNSCGCGLRGTFTNPVVTNIGSYGVELDTGGPGVWLERPDAIPTER
jgi:hypothetical protein